MKIGWTKPKEVLTDWDDAKIKVANFNSRALNALFQGRQFRNVSAGYGQYISYWFKYRPYQTRFDRTRIYTEFQPEIRYWIGEKKKKKKRSI